MFLEHSFNHWTIIRQNMALNRLEDKISKIEQNTMNNEWQPIETAPKNDENCVLLHGYVRFGKNISSTYIKLTFVGFYEPHKLFPEYDWVVMSYGNDEVRINPTHWMPLPNPPKK